MFLSRSLLKLLLHTLMRMDWICHKIINHVTSFALDLLYYSILPTLALAHGFKVDAADTHTRAIACCLTFLPQIAASVPSHSLSQSLAQFLSQSQSHSRYPILDSKGIRVTKDGLSNQPPQPHLKASVHARSHALPHCTALHCTAKA